MLPRLEYRIVCAAAALLIYAVIGWYRVLDPTERTMLMEQIHGFKFKVLAPDQIS